MILKQWTDKNSEMKSSFQNAFFDIRIIANYLSLLMKNIYMILMRDIDLFPS